MCYPLNCSPPVSVRQTLPTRLSRAANITSARTSARNASTADEGEGEGTRGRIRSEAQDEFGVKAQYFFNAVQDMKNQGRYRARSEQRKSLMGETCEVEDIWE